VRFYYGNSRFDPATGVTVGVIDTGVGPHHDLNVVSGRNTVTGEPAAAWQDWFEHGTHVSGLIGASGTPPNGLRGMAPGVPIRAYRVFGKNAQGATNYAILKAMIFAATDGCDIINLSLGGGPNEPIVEEAISDARDQGMLVMVAAGNDGRQPVNYPAAYAGSTAVSALGREGTYPVGSVASAEALRPPNSTVDAAEFIAEFSNIGSRVALTAPGVGVLSTLPNNAYGPMSGTSMAAPVAAGAAACLLSRDPAVFALARDRARSDAIEKLLQSHGAKRGFGLVFEGYGLPDPNQV
jgi:subtilisin family serine protease